MYGLWMEGEAKNVVDSFLCAQSGPSLLDRGLAVLEGQVGGK